MKMLKTITSGLKFSASLFRMNLNICLFPDANLAWLFLTPFKFSSLILKQLRLAGCNCFYAFRAISDSVFTDALNFLWWSWRELNLARVPHAVSYFSIPSTIQDKKIWFVFEKRHSSMALNPFPKLLVHLVGLHESVILQSMLLNLSCYLRTGTWDTYILTCMIYMCCRADILYKQRIYLAWIKSNHENFRKLYLISVYYVLNLNP